MVVVVAEVQLSLTRCLQQPYAVMMMVVVSQHNSLAADYVVVVHIEEFQGVVVAGAQHQGVVVVALQGVELQEGIAAVAEEAAPAVEEVASVVAEAQAEVAASAGRRFVSADHSEHVLAGPGRQDIAAEGGHLDHRGVAPDCIVLLALEQWEEGLPHLEVASMVALLDPVEADLGPVRIIEAFQRTD